MPQMGTRAEVLECQDLKGLAAQAVDIRLLPCNLSPSILCLFLPYPRDGLLKAL